MTFEEVLDQAIAMLQRRGRVTYNTLKRQFNLDDEALEDLKEELIEAEQLAVDQDGKMLVWIGDNLLAPTPAIVHGAQEPVSPPASTAARQQQAPPLAYTPAYLTEKILTSRSALEGERKQVTVLFADIKDSTEMITDLDVVVRTIGNDLHMDYSAVGPTTHLAARMEQLATPGSTRVSAATLRLVEGLVQVNALGPIPIKGMTAPVEVFELTGASTIRRRLQAAATRGLTRFVGRDTEIEVLRRALEQASAGHGQVVAVVGEAGVGKSRLVYECVHSHRTQGWLVLESASVSYGKATPYFPVRDLLKRYVHVEDGDEPRSAPARSPQNSKTWRFRWWRISLWPLPTMISPCMARRLSFCGAILPCSKAT